MGTLGKGWRVASNTGEGRGGWGEWRCHWHAPALVGEGRGGGVARFAEWHALISTPAHARPPSTCHPNPLTCNRWGGVLASGVGWGRAHPLTRARPALHKCLPPSKRTRSRATNGAVLGRGVRVGVGVGSGVGHLLTRTRPALHPRLPPNRHARSRAPAQHCAHALRDVAYDAAQA